MKYDFLVKENSKNLSDKNDNNQNENENNNKSFIGSTMLSTYEDFKIFLKKKQENSSNDINNKNNNEINKVKNSKDEDNKDKSTYFESEKKTVETIVKYSSSFINLLLKLFEMLKNILINLISKKKINTEITRDIEIINKFNRKKKKNKKRKLANNDYKYNEKKDKDIDKKKYIVKKEEDNIKKMNSYLIELD